MDADHMKNMMAEMNGDFSHIKDPRRKRALAKLKKSGMQVRRPCQLLRSSTACEYLRCTESTAALLMLLLLRPPPPPLLLLLRPLLLMLLLLPLSYTGRRRRSVVSRPWTSSSSRTSST
jgi:hypothetical protein